jgi:glutamate-1-semialdehyde 2,1-aminomutase
MAEFLTRIRQPRYQQIYARADALWNERVARLNGVLEDQSLPVRLANMHSVITVLYTQPSRYNWMLQFYLRGEGLELSWTGSGRLIMNLEYSDEDLADVADRFVRGVRQMQADGWWWSAPHLTNRWIRRQMLKDMLASRLSGRSTRIAGVPAAGQVPAENLP